MRVTETIAGDTFISLFLNSPIVSVTLSKIYF